MTCPQARSWLRREQVVDKKKAEEIQNAGVPFVWIAGEKKNHKVLSNMMVDLASYVSFDPEEIGVTELVFYLFFRIFWQKMTERTRRP